MVFWIVNVLLLTFLIHNIFYKDKEYGHTKENLWFALVFTTISWIVFGMLLGSMAYQVKSHTVGHLDGNVSIIKNYNGGKVYEFTIDGKRYAMDHVGDSANLNLSNKNTLVKHDHKNVGWYMPWTLDDTGPTYTINSLATIGN